MVHLDFSALQLGLRKDGERTSVFDPVRKKWLVLTPEEHVRQYVIQYLVQVLHYPLALMAVEKKVLVGKMPRRYDIVVYDRNHTPWLIVECKAPDVPLTQVGLQQLLSYHSTLQCAYWLLTNGHQAFCAHCADSAAVTWLSSLPAYQP